MSETWHVEIEEKRVTGSTKNDEEVILYILNLLAEHGILEMCASIVALIAQTTY